jgi:hypothetical protein
VHATIVDMKPELQKILTDLRKADHMVEPIAAKSAPGSDLDTIAHAIHHLVHAVRDLAREFGGVDGEDWTI